MDLIELIGDTVIIIGEILLAYSVIAVHARIQDEHKVDGAVFREMYKEEIIAILSILLLSVGFAIRVFGRYVL